MQTDTNTEVTRYTNTSGSPLDGVPAARHAAAFATGHEPVDDQPRPGKGQQVIDTTDTFRVSDCGCDGRGR